MPYQTGRMASRSEPRRPRRQTVERNHAESARNTQGGTKTIRSTSSVKPGRKDAMLSTTSDYETHLRCTTLESGGFKFIRALRAEPASRTGCGIGDPPPPHPFRRRSAVYQRFVADIGLENWRRRYRPFEPQLRRSPGQHEGRIAVLARLDAPEQALVDLAALHGDFLGLVSFRCGAGCSGSSLRARAAKRRSGRFVGQSAEPVPTSRLRACRLFRFVHDPSRDVRQTVIGVPPPTWSGLPRPRLADALLVRSS